MSAARHGKRNDFLYLKNLGADINAVNHVGSSALSHAVSWRNRVAIHALIELGIDIQLHGGKALRTASWHGDLEIVELLISKGADINYHGRDQVHPNCPAPL